MEKLEKIKCTLLDGIDMALSQGLNNVDATEMGYAIDMLKDIASTEYYEAVLKEMKESGTRMTAKKYKDMSVDELRDIDREMGRMYYTETQTMQNKKEPPMLAHRGQYLNAKTNKLSQHERIEKLGKYLDALAEDIETMVDGGSAEEMTLVRTKMQNLVDMM